MRLSFEIDEGSGTRAALGLIVLQVDETIEGEFRRYLDIDGVALYHSRVPSAPDVTPETLARMEAEIPAAVALLPPSIDFDVIGYACTSGATIIGEAAVADAVRSVRPDVAVTNPLTAVKQACRALGVRKLGFVTPYVADVSAAMRAALEDDGLAITGFGSFERSEERVVARIAPQSSLQAILDVGQSQDCDAVFVSCTNLRVASVLAEAERRLAKPVISSNQALAWHMLRLAGVSDDRPGSGKLFGCGLLSMG